MNVTTAFELYEEIPKSMKSLLIANSNATFIHNGNWGFLSNLTNLEQLSFINNNITNIAEFKSIYMEDLDILETLLITNNNLKLFPVDKFANLKRLKSLDLSCNQLRTVGQGPWDLSLLQTLRLNYNQIESVRGGQLRGLSNLITLDLSNNIITYFSLKVLASVSKLKFLELYNNRLLYVSEYNVLHKNLTYISLSNNYFESLSPLVFTGLQALGSLAFTRNQIKDTPSTNYNDTMTSVKRLSLKLNGIERMTPFFFDGFPELESIILSYNRIRHVAYNTFRSVPNLVAIDFSYNEIHSIPGNLFQHLNNLFLIELESNRINTLPPDIFRSLSKLTTLYIYNNPIACNCSVVPLIQWLRRAMMSSVYHPTCQSPESLRNQIISLVDLPSNCSDSSLVHTFNATPTISFTHFDASDPFSFKWRSIGAAVGVLMVCLCLLYLSIMVHRD
ncbi:Leucine-rich repeat-containing protein 15 [Holothuria leucospilota]|uniref:Leucine-rich repeat-containing protein 15 n=1 Tax=Holothuria leucospilota TaxID=206669 RepID=A0A9Q0YG18_HOLLE|nr:Leucine-rich repeat-containing protein 15 [Holothuria leucospilota]